MKFAANLNFMFTEHGDMVSRYIAAKAAGFTAVESVPYEVPLEKLVEVQKREGLEQVLINAPPGDWSAGERGFAALPGRQNDFQKSLDLAIQYAKGLNCKRVHVMAGVVPSDSSADKQTLLQEMEEVFIENLKYAADRLQKEGMMAIIEPINTLISIPGYFLNTPSQAAAIIKKVNHKNLKLQLDLYHAQLMRGNLTGLIKEYLPIIGHIQVAQVPDRGEPDSPGEINYSYIFELLESLGYDGFVGCEYKPTTKKTEDSLGWLKNMKSLK